MTLKNRRELSIDGLKGIAIFMVVWGHVICSLSGKEIDALTMPIQRIIYLVHMPLFMFLSGMVSKRYIEEGSIHKGIWKKIIQLILPMSAWCLITWLMVLPWGGQVLTFRGVLKSLYSAFYSSYWFIWSLFICSIYTKFCATVSKGKHIWMVVLVLLFYLLPNNAHLLFLHMNSTKTMLPYYVAGYFLTKYDWKYYASIRWLFVVSLVFYVFCCFIVKQDWFMYYLNLDIWNINSSLRDYFHLLFLLVSGFSGIYCLLYISQKIDWNKKITYSIQLTGRYTLGIYMIQGIIFNVILRKYPLVWGNDIGWFIISIGLTVLCLLLVIIIKKTPLIKRIV